MSSQIALELSCIARFEPFLSNARKVRLSESPGDNRIQALVVEANSVG